MHCTPWTFRSGGTWGHLAQAAIPHDHWVLRLKGLRTNTKCTGCLLLSPQKCVCLLSSHTVTNPALQLQRRPPVSVASSTHCACVSAQRDSSALPVHTPPTATSRTDKRREYMQPQLMCPADTADLEACPLSPENGITPTPPPDCAPFPFCQPNKVQGLRSPPPECLGLHQRTRRAQGVSNFRASPLSSSTQEHKTSFCVSGNHERKTPDFRKQINVPREQTFFHFLVAIEWSIACEEQLHDVTCNRAAA